LTQTVKLFARLRDLAGAELVSVSLPHLATVADLRNRLAAEFPALGPLVARSAVAVNAELAADETPIHAGDEIAVLPPVSGG
jgi:sulfur-carrier protein